MVSREELIDLLQQHGQAFHMTGSRYICDPAPTDTDEDWIVFDPTGAAERALGRSGFQRNTDPTLYDNLPDFWAYRMGEFNVIATPERTFYDRFVAATVLAKMRNILGKEDRISLFQSILYGSH